MKITAGLGSTDAYDAYVDAGADEVFCGYVPEWWASRYGLALPLNRREVRYYGVQIGGRNELLHLADRIAARGKPASITINSLHYTPEQYPLIAELVEQCLHDGFHSFIVADMGLLVYLHMQGLDEAAQLHISGEMSEINHGMIALCRRLGARRIIFHRKVTMAEMGACTARDADHGMEYEAFLLNEMCHFHGAFCHSLHCDELAHVCHLPYQLGAVDISQYCIPTTVSNEQRRKERLQTIVGSTGCGLCALWQLRQAGVGWLKIVGRGNHADAMVRDVAAAREALDTLDNAATENEFIQNMKQRLFPGGCSEQCYYR